MKRITNNCTISINQSTTEVSHKDAVTSTDSHPALDGEATAATTVSIEQPGVLSLRNIFNTFKSYIFSSEDETGIRYTPRDLGYLANDREPMFVIVDSSCVSNPSSRELLIDNRYHTRDPILKRHFCNNNVMPVDMPSTSRDLRNDFKAETPLLMESESTDEMQMIDINLQSDGNELLIGSDSDCDNDSIVMSYLKNKDAFLDLEGTLISTKRKSSLLEHVPKMETIVESELFYSFPIIPQSDSASLNKLIWSEDSSSDGYFIPKDLGDDSPPTATPMVVQQSTSDIFAVDLARGRTSLPIQNYEGLTEATEFLHQNQAFLIAAETANENMLRILIDEGTNIHLKDHFGRNALHFAVHSENQKVVYQLLEAGVDPNVQDDLGMTPLTLCLMRSPNLAMAKLLLDHGALVTPRKSPVEPGLFLQFVMMCVPTAEEESILRLLVERAGALVNDPDAPGGRKPLHFAAMSNNIRLIKILVSLGADLFQVNHRNETPKQVAAIFHNKEAYALLERFEEMRDMIVALNTPANELEMYSEDSTKDSQEST